MELTVAQIKKDHDYYMGFVDNMKKNSKCSEKQVGAIIVLNDKIIATATNGVPFGLTACSHQNHEAKRGCLDAEQYVIAEAARAGVSTDGSTLYSTFSPCFKCAQQIIAAGIKEIIYKEEFEDKEGLVLLERAGIKALQIR